MFVFINGWLYRSTWLEVGLPPAVWKYRFCRKMFPWVKHSTRVRPRHHNYNSSCAAKIGLSVDDPVCPLHLFGQSEYKNPHYYIHCKGLLMYRAYVILADVAQWTGGLQWFRVVFKLCMLYRKEKGKICYTHWIELCHVVFVHSLYQPWLLTISIFLFTLARDVVDAVNTDPLTPSPDGLQLDCCLNWD